MAKTQLAWLAGMAVVAVAAVVLAMKLASAPAPSLREAPPVAASAKSEDAYELRDAPDGGKTLNVPALGIEAWLGQDPTLLRGQFTEPFLVDTTDLGYRGPNGECIVIWFKRNASDERAASAVLDDLQKERVDKQLAVLGESREVVANSLVGREVTLRRRGGPQVTGMRERYFVRDRMVFLIVGRGEGIHGEAEVDRCLSSFRLNPSR